MDAMRGKTDTAELDVSLLVCGTMPLCRMKVRAETNLFGGNNNAHPSSHGEGSLGDGFSCSACHRVR